MTQNTLTHWGRTTHICVGNLTVIGSDNGLSPDRRQAIIWTNAGISLIEPLRTNFSEISIEIHTFSFKKMYFKMSSVKWRPFCPVPRGLSWWRHQMETFSTLLALCAGNSPVTDEFLSQRPVTRCFDVFFDLRLYKATSHYLNQWWLNYWRIYASLGLNELIHHFNSLKTHCG